MSWLALTGSLAHQLRGLLSPPRSMTHADIGVFAAAHDTIMLLVGEVYYDPVMTDDRLPWPVAYVRTQHLDRALGGQPQPLAPLVAPPTAPGQTHLTATGRDWQHAGRTAQLARAEWEASDSASRPTGIHTVPLLCDITALAHARALSTIAYAPVMTGLDRSGWESVIAHSRLVTRATPRALAALHGRQGLPDYGDPHETAPARAIEITSPSDLRRGMGRLSRLLARTEHVPPAMLAHLTLLHGRVTDDLADTLRRASPPGTASKPSAAGEALRQHANRLAQVSAPSPTRLASITPTGEAALAAYRQAGLLLRYLDTLRIQSDPLDRLDTAALWGAACYVPTVTRALAHLARHHLDTGRWLTAAPPAGDATSAIASERSPFIWVPTGPTTPTPLRRQLEHAAKDAGRLQRALPQPRPMRPARAFLATPASPRPVPATRRLATPTR